MRARGRKKSYSGKGLFYGYQASSKLKYGRGKKRFIKSKHIQSYSKNKFKRYAKR